jgi:hypothetical protein
MTILMPADFFQNKNRPEEKQQDIVINILHIVNIAAPNSW